MGGQGEFWGKETRDWGTWGWQGEVSQLLSFPALLLDTGYREPSRAPRNVLLFCFIGLLSVLSILGTALLLWKKVRMHAHTQAQPRCPSTPHCPLGVLPWIKGLPACPARCTSWSILARGPRTGVPCSLLHQAASSPYLWLGLSYQLITMNCKKSQLFSLCCPGSSPFPPAPGSSHPTLAPGFINHLPGIWVSLLPHSTPHALA